MLVYLLKCILYSYKYLDEVDIIYMFRIKVNFKENIWIVYRNIVQFNTSGKLGWRASNPPDKENVGVSTYRSMSVLQSIIELSRLFLRKFKMKEECDRI